jgi:pyruvate dehydrogenase E1 component beta subunit
MPYSVSDARDLLIASVLCDDPVIFIDDRWLYDLTDEISPIKEIQLTTVAPLIISPGSDITIAASGYSVHLALEAKKVLKNSNIDAEIVDLRVLNPYNHLTVSESVLRTGRLLVIDGGWANSGFAGEVIASAVENISMAHFKSNPRRITLPPTPAPSAKSLEKGYYPTPEDIIKTIIEMMK